MVLCEPVLISASVKSGPDIEHMCFAGWLHACSLEPRSAHICNTCALLAACIVMGITMPHAQVTQLGIEANDMIYIKAASDPTPLGVAPTPQ